MKRIRYTGIGSIYLAYRRQEVPHPLDAFGLVIPAAERRPIDGMTWTSTKWPGRSPDDVALIRVFFGGPNSRASLTLDEAQVLAMAHRECREMLGVNGSPVFHRIHRWPDGYPQYDLGHLALVDEIDRSLPPGILVAGCSYRGVGVPDCVRQGTEAAERVLNQINSI
jgi:oxygen-dependent protoporphyrinogen oxidase